MTSDSSCKPTCRLDALGKNKEIFESWSQVTVAFSSKGQNLSFQTVFFSDKELVKG